MGPPISQPVRLPFLSVSLSEKATSVPLSRPGVITAIASMPRLAFIALGAGRKRNRPASADRIVGGEGIAKDAVLALEGDVGRALPGCHRQGHAFRIAVLVVEQRLAVGAEERAEHRIAQAFQLPPVIVEVALSQVPASEMASSVVPDGIERERRVAAEVGGLGEEVEPAPKISLPNSFARGCSRSKSMGMAVMVSRRSRGQSAVSGLSAKAGATTRHAAIATSAAARLRQASARRRAAR